MYIIAIAWMYVILMMSITENSVVAGILTFVFYGLFPVLILLYLMGTPQRKRNRDLAKQRGDTARENNPPADDTPPAGP